MLARIFPLRRGLFEDKVASFWCVLNNFVKVHQVLPQAMQIRLATVLTLVTALPSNVLLLRSPSAKNLVVCLFTTSLCFFLYSFHVHEKQILLPLLVFGLQALTEYRHYCSMFVMVANFSMFQLYCKDNNQLNYIALNIIWLVVGRLCERYSLTSYVVSGTSVIGEPSGVNNLKSGLLIYNDSYKLNIAE